MSLLFKFVINRILKAAHNSIVIWIVICLKFILDVDIAFFFFFFYYDSSIMNIFMPKYWLVFHFISLNVMLRSKIISGNVDE